MPLFKAGAAKWIGLAAFISWNCVRTEALASEAAIFQRYCSVCHSLEEGKNKYGPSLAGVVGRRSASVQNFSYSSAMRSLRVTWTKENLDKFLAGPAEMVPGTLMIFPGVKKEDERNALIEYLMAPRS